MSSGNNHVLTDIPNRQRIIQITGATTINPNIHNDTVMNCSITGSLVPYTISLPTPAVATGCKFRFVVVGLSVTVGANIVIAAPATNINGCVTIASVAAVVINRISLSFAQTNTTIGDFIEVVSNGTTYMAQGAGGVAGSIIFA